MIFLILLYVHALSEIMPTFSPQLILRTQRIFEKRSSVPVSVEQAEMILERLAKIGLLMQAVKENEKQKGGDPHG